MPYKLQQLLRFPRTVVNKIVSSYQRITRGYSTEDWWSLDYHLAHILSQTLVEYVERDTPISMNYFDEGADYFDEGADYDDEEAYDAAVERRNTDYLKYADFFTRYCDGGMWNKKEDAEELNGVTVEEYEEAMQWLAKNFANLWY